MNELLSSLALGLATATTVNNLLYCLLGVTLGTLVGALPGIGALAAISMLFPITFYLDPTAALIMLAGIYYGSAYGGSIASILLNLPGAPSSAVTVLDGHPMAVQGRAGVALLMTAVASFIGASIGILILMLFSPILVTFALRFGPAEYFSLMLMGLVAASAISGESVIKGIAMVVFGILLGTIGTDLYTGNLRFTFGVVQLTDGLNLVAIAMGVFGVTEVISSIRSGRPTMRAKDITLRSMVPTRDDVRRSWMPILRGSLIGSFFGALPGTGGTIASFISYVSEKKLNKDPSRFGHGAIEGITAPEAANNAADQTAFIPTLALGIPGTATMALMLGVMIIHGIQPGPSLINQHPEVFWGLIMSFWIGNIILMVLNIPLIGVFVRLLLIPYHYLYPSILMFLCVGLLSINNDPFDVLMVAIVGVIGYLLRLLSYPAAPLLLGFVLGPLMEEHFRRAMLVSRGNWEVFVTRPISLTFLLVTLGLLAWGIWGSYRRQRPQALA